MLSVCIAVYNAGKYLPRCLNSVAGQTLSDMEIVIVNDGSTDNSWRIVNDFKREHPGRRIVLHEREKNSGIAEARKTCVELACGDYIQFVDADDEILPNMCETLYACTKGGESYDIIECGHTRIETVGNKVVQKDSIPFRSGAYPAREVLRAYLEKHDIWEMLWKRIFKRELFQRGKVFWKESSPHEDAISYPVLLAYAETVYYVPLPLYRWYFRKDSSSTGDDVTAFRNRIRMLTALHDMSVDLKAILGEAYEEAIEKYFTQLIFWTFESGRTKVSYKEKLKSICGALQMGPEELRRFLRRRADDRFFYKAAANIGLGNAYRLLMIRHLIKSIVKKQ